MTIAELSYHLSKIINSGGAYEEIVNIYTVPKKCELHGNNLISVDDDINIETAYDDKYNRVFELRAGIQDLNEIRKENIETEWQTLLNSLTKEKNS